MRGLNPFACRVLSVTRLQGLVRTGAVWRRLLREGADSPYYNNARGLSQPAGIANILVIQDEFSDARSVKGTLTG